MLLLIVYSRELANQLFASWCESKVKLLWFKSLAKVILTNLPVLHYSSLALVNIMPAELLLKD